MATAFFADSSAPLAQSRQLPRKRPQAQGRLDSALPNRYTLGLEIEFLLRRKFWPGDSVAYRELNLDRHFIIIQRPFFHEANAGGLDSIEYEFRVVDGA